MAAKARHRLIVVWTWVGAVLLTAVGVYLAGILSIPIGIIIWTTVFVFMFRGTVNWLDDHGVNRTIGTTIAFVLFAAVIAILVYVVFSPAFGIDAQFEELAKSLPAYIEGFRTWAVDLYERYADVLQNDQVRSWISSATSAIGDTLQGAATSAASGVVAAGTSIANIVMCVGFALVIAFWMLIDLPRLGREVNRIISDERRPDFEMIHVTVMRVVGGYLKATIVQCAIIGIACGIMYAVLGVPSPVAIGTITGIMNIIPIVGPWLGGALAFIASTVESPLVGIISLVGTIVIQQAVYTFVSPKLMGESVDIHPALTFIALMAGSGIGTAMGGLMGALVGALLSIPLVAIVKSLFVYYFEKKTGRRIVAEDGVFFKGAAPEGAEFDPMTDATAPMPAVSSETTGRIIGIPELVLKNAYDEKQAEDATGDAHRPAHRKQ